ncbi:hypothetical protein HNR40_002828 [Nonomuraea endophytica]|uniref:Uncharacterized protein n=1 Tax=Nonomuraea endophytica TaxID=714136 RepID=A0A7W8A0M0_9ACTN|nr:hypothetical protein [Nonomuraea endophytica]
MTTRLGCCVIFAWPSALSMVTGNAPAACPAAGCSAAGLSAERTLIQD